MLLLFTSFDLIFKTVRMGETFNRYLIKGSLFFIIIDFEGSHHLTKWSDYSNSNSGHYKLEAQISIKIQSQGDVKLSISFFKPFNIPRSIKFLRDIRTVTYKSLLRVPCWQRMLTRTRDFQHVQELCVESATVIPPCLHTISKNPPPFTLPPVYHFHLPTKSFKLMNCLGPCWYSWAEMETTALDLKSSCGVLGC